MIAKCGFCTCFSSPMLRANEKDTVLFILRSALVIEVVFLRLISEKRSAFQKRPAN